MRINGISVRGYFINKTPFELQNLPDRLNEFKKNEIEGMGGITF